MIDRLERAEKLIQDIRYKRMMHEHKFFSQWASGAGIPKEVKAWIMFLKHCESLISRYIKKHQDNGGDGK